MRSVSNQKKAEPFCLNLLLFHQHSWAVSKSCFNVYIHRTINSATTQQGEEPTVKGAYMITTPTYLGTTEHTNTPV
jgi:hypothetical protein